MGLISAALSSAKGVLADQWKEFFYCDAIDNDTLVVKGQKRTTGRSVNKGTDNIISNGSVIAVADGQCMLIVEQGKVVDLCAEPGEFVYDASTEPSVFTGKLGDNIKSIFKTVCKRFTFGGDTAKEQRVYYFNTKEIIGNKYGTPSPVPFRVVDEAAGIDLDISIRCFGEYSYRICNPLLFYTNICGNVANSYKRSEIESQMKSELLNALQPAFARISEMGIRYSALPGHTTEVADALNSVLFAKWRDYRGMEIVNFGISSVNATAEDEAMIKQMQQAKAYVNPALGIANLARAQANAMQDAAKNSAGAAMGFMGMNMAGGMNIQNLYQQAAAAPAAEPTAKKNTWKCPACGAEAEGKFCPECGAKKPEVNTWKCSCGAVNKGKFCAECGAKKPAGIPQYKCDKCGWEPEDPAHPPKFCPECGDPFDTGDIVG